MRSATPDAQGRRASAVHIVGEPRDQTRFPSAAALGPESVCTTWLILPGTLSPERVDHEAFRLERRGCCFSRRTRGKQKPGHQLELSRRSSRRPYSDGGVSTEIPSTALNPRGPGWRRGYVSGSSGRNTVKVVPSPSRLSTAIVPPWRVTISLTTANPSPTPWICRALALSAR